MLEIGELESRGAQGSEVGGIEVKAIFGQGGFGKRINYITMNYITKESGKQRIIKKKFCE